MDGPDPWPAAHASEMGIREHKNFRHRCRVIQRLVDKKRLNVPFLADGMDNKVAEAYLGHPVGLYLVRKDGRLGIAGKQGPEGFSPALREAEKWLERFKETGIEPDITPDSDKGDTLDPEGPQKSRVALES